MHLHLSALSALRIILFCSSAIPIFSLRPLDIDLHTNGIPKNILVPSNEQSHGNLTYAAASAQEWEQNWASLSCEPRYGILDSFQQVFHLERQQHKRLWPLAVRDYIGFVLVILVLFIAAGGGIGGGGAIIPLYILFLGFDTKVAVALGNITIVGGSLSNFVFNAPRRHAVFNRPLIDWDLILVMEPSTILGALVGGYINKVLPAWLTTVLLGALLTFITYKLVTRGIVTWHSETEQIVKEDDQQQPLLQEEHNQQESPQTSQSQAIETRPSKHVFHGDSYSPLAYSNSLARSSKNKFIREQLRRQSIEAIPQIEETQSEPDDVLHDDDSDADEEERRRAANSLGETSSQPLPSTRPAKTAASLPQTDSAASNSNDQNDSEDTSLVDRGHEDGLNDKQKELDDRFAERRQLPPVRVGIMILLTAVVGVSDYFKGRVQCGSWLYWLLVLIIIPVVAVVTFAARSYLLRKRKAKTEAGYEWREGDVDWNPVTTLTYPAICSVAGLVAGMFGVGGGIVKGPLMLELGVLADVASATSATMIVFTSASASIVFLSFGGIPTNYAIVVFVIGIIFTMLGQIACYILMRALGRRSIIVFAMAALMILSMVITYYEAIVGIIAAVHAHRLWAFGRICR